MKLKSPLKLKDAAEILTCEYLGNPDHLITGINEIHRVEVGDLTFVDVEKYYDKALGSLASTVLINKAIEVPKGKGLLVTEDPFSAYNKLTEHFQPTPSNIVIGNPQLGTNVSISPKAVVGENVSIGEGSEIGHGVVVGSNVKIGKHCCIHANVSIYDHSEIGDFVTINAGTVIGSEAFYFKNRPVGRDKMLTKGRVVIEDHVDIGANCTIDRGVSADTTIGKWTKIDNLVQVGHDTIIGEKCLIASQVGIAGVVTLEDEVVLWGQVGVNKDLTIGKGAQLYGKTGVMSDLEGGKTYLGMIADDARQKLREVAAIKKLPELIRKWEKFFKNRED
ncbi:MAG: UDP-3-O-(3-hydroxymyristoyl)glucosamine N-acyltransferase [Bacteroidia bacterium]|nr:UDP-3-O-(3-hydroxymyristoyl)glucosamine N-acyltransferase [Bacteroidia bacterium]